MRIWDDVIPKEDMDVFLKAGFGRKMELGRKPSLLVIDVTYDFVGDFPEPIIKSVERFPLSCGDRGWFAVYKIKQLLELAREKKIPVIYSAPTEGRGEADFGKWFKKQSRNCWASSNKLTYFRGIVKEISPYPGELIIRKNAPSVFCGTPLLGYLIACGVDTLLVSGCTTSGCVRASVVDAFSYNFKVGVIEECVFDRFLISHKVSLFDIHAKYGQVLSLEEAEEYISSL